jgi:hypothetical protein
MSFGSLAIATTILLVICMMVVVSANTRYTNYLSGYWVIHPDFATKASLDDFQLFIGPPATGLPTRAGYVIIVDNKGTTVANSAVDIGVTTLSGSAAYALLQGKADECRGRLTLEFTDKAAAGSLPKALDYSLSILNGTLTLYNAGAVYACLVKDIAVTDTALYAYTASDN